ncbi:MAG: H-NS family nucleoid-associated regulatory protein [Albidovulum sp.]
MKIDLDSLSLKELKNLQSQVSERIANYEQRRKQEALAALEEKAREMGYSLSELLAVAPARKRRAGQAKYANPDDRSQTWSGRGRRPRWVEAALKAGKSLDDLLI